MRGLLIADRIRQGDEGHGKTYQDANLFDIRTWSNLLMTAETMHKEFLDVVKERAPADDPRMQELSTDDVQTKKRARPNVKKTKQARGKSAKGKQLRKLKIK